MAVNHVDVKSAYLHGDLDEEIFMRLPPGVEAEEKDAVCRLRRSIYGLKQSARMWNQKLDSVMKKMGFSPGAADSCLYVRRVGGKCAYILVYVDDLLIACSSYKEYSEIMRVLGSEFPITELGEVGHFLGIQIEKSGDRYYLNQKTYIRKLAERFGMQDAKTSRIPMDTGYGQQKEESEKLPNNDLYQSLLGGLLYLAVNTRPDIAICASLLGRKVSQPTAADWVEAKRVLRYLLTTAELKLCLGGNGELEAFADADWAGNSTDRKSNSGCLFKLGVGPVFWLSRKQSCVALSSTEAEYISLSECCKELQWLLKLMEDFGEEPKLPIKVREDNQGCIKLLKQDGGTKRSKHIDTSYHFVRDLAEKQQMEVVYCSSEDMLADLLTKPLSRVKLEILRERVDLQFTC